jgi:RecJ-like exonuclease
MIKVRIHDQCDFCDGDAYVFVCEDSDSRGETFDRFRPCEMCHGSDNRAKWVSLRELSDLLERAIAMEPDYLELAREKPVSQYQDSRDSAGI